MYNTIICTKISHSDLSMEQQLNNETKGKSLGEKTDVERCISDVEVPIESTMMKKLSY